MGLITTVRGKFIACMRAGRRPASTASLGPCKPPPRRLVPRRLDYAAPPLGKSAAEGRALGGRPSLALGRLGSEAVSAAGALALQPLSHAASRVLQPLRHGAQPDPERAQKRQHDLFRDHHRPPRGELGRARRRLPARLKVLHQLAVGWLALRDQVARIIPPVIPRLHRKHGVVSDRPQPRDRIRARCRRRRARLRRHRRGLRRHHRRRPHVGNDLERIGGQCQWWHEHRRLGLGSQQHAPVLRRHRREQRGGGLDVHLQLAVGWLTLLDQSAHVIPAPPPPPVRLSPHAPPVPRSRAPPSPPAAAAPALPPWPCPPACAAGSGTAAAAAPPPPPSLAPPPWPPPRARGPPPQPAARAPPPPAAPPVARPAAAAPPPPAAAPPPPPPPPAAKQSTRLPQHPAAWAPPGSRRRRVAALRAR
eukprot:scaffold1519_cov69-Phaeocystis_antarctica.AAC.2